MKSNHRYCDGRKLEDIDLLGTQENNRKITRREQEDKK